MLTLQGVEKGDGNSRGESAYTERLASLWLSWEKMRAEMPISVNMHPQHQQAVMIE